MSKSILLVEDDSMLRETIKYQIEDSGFKVLEADSASAAKKIIDEHPHIKLIISDLNMGEVSGLDLAEWIRDHKEKSIQKSPFVLMTGYTDKFDADRARSLDVKSFLAKPFDHEFLIHTIQTLLYGQSEPAA